MTTKNAKDAKTAAEFLSPGRKVDLKLYPEAAAGLGFASSEAATIVESSPLGLLTVLALHASKGGDTLAFIPWQNISAVFVSLTNAE